MRDEDLKLSYWLVSSRPLVHRLAIGAFCALDLALIIFAGVLGVRFFSSANAQEAVVQSLAENWVHYASANERSKPTLPTVSATAILNAEGGKYTLVAVAQNPSDRWALLTVDYTMSIDQQVIAEGSTSFRPDEERYLVAFQTALARVSASSAVQVTFRNPTWQRVLAESDLPTLRLTIANPFYRLLSSVPGNQLSQVTATIRNESVVAVADVEVTALLMNGTAIVGVGRLTLSELNGLESRPIDIRLFQVVTTTNVRMAASVDLAEQVKAAKE